jgi:hypothetical protein
VVSATTAALASVFQGYEPWSRAVASGDVQVAGPTRLARSLPQWFLWSPFADATRARARAAAGISRR